MSRQATLISPHGGTPKGVSPSVFSNERTIEMAGVDLPNHLHLNQRLRMDALTMLTGIPANTTPAAFFDPQYRGVLDEMSYGNEGKSRGKARCELRQMSEQEIARIIRELDRVIAPMGHLFLWIDKFHLCTGYREWLNGTQLETVDLITWNKLKLGMGYRTRRVSEYLVVVQQLPRRAKGVWTSHAIRDVWDERIERKEHAHHKPVGLQAELIEAVTNPGDIVVDPAAGSFSVMEAANLRGRHFLGCDILG